ncbi:MAG: cupin domain-containing protein, partial [Gammaproteobacteria bacterium]|nr:cupin domain-containing protein [Gammaproteobacteria bacterium]
IANKNCAQDVKILVQQLKDMQRAEALDGNEVFRPWGSYEVLKGSNGFQVKRLCIKPGGRLSLQLHNHRAEHWVVVRGVAKVTLGEKEFNLHENESTYVPKETKHRLENDGEEPVEIIEIQTGSYLGEDDIVRFDDCYGRVSEGKKPE